MVEIGFYYVNWDAFLDEVARGERPRRGSRVRLSYSSLRRQSNFVGEYHRFRRAWLTEARTAFEEFFGALFWTGFDEAGRIEDASGIEGADVVWSPATAQRFADVWDRVELESARDPFERCPTEYWGDGPSQQFEEWAGFAQEHGQMVARAASRGRGLVEYVF